jgi:serine/threonine protein kinase
VAGDAQVGDGQAQRYYSMFVVDKRDTRWSVYDLRAINRFVSVLRDLDNFRHPNLSHLVATLHTPDRLCLVTSMCGRQTLFMRLKSRDRPSASTSPVPLPVVTIRSLIQKICAAISHLHLVASLCHRDIKPENFTVATLADDTVDIKLGGFELAMVQTAGVKCKSACGTIPFAPPEVVAAGSGGYDGLAADMWSIGILFTEIACGLRSVEDRILDINGKDPNNRKDKEGLLRPSPKTAKKMVFAFMQENFIENLYDNMVPEARELKEWLLPGVSSLLQVHPGDRPTAAMLKDFMPAP